MEIYDYTTEGGKNLIEEYIDKLPPSEKIRVHEVREDIRCYGENAIKYLNSRQLRGKIWEIKITQTRIAYILISEDAIAFLHIFKKQKRKTELKEIEIAIARAKRVGLL